MGKREEKQKAAELCGYRNATAGEIQCRDCVYSSPESSPRLECHNVTAMKGFIVAKLNTCDRSKAKKDAPVRGHGGARKGAGAPKLPQGKKKKPSDYPSASIRLTGEFEGWTPEEVRRAAIWAKNNGFQR